ncbi:MAG: tRNA (guanosine(37)-N1)-methyltransferase TrmD [Deltaproteobacteria bacterium RIFCSPLOWO2_12_FULL_60_19]|nr:MAG: tRNA (guanosine(37)-N1)-methyltransferase TrmD [Deltaproteobacteria bacterium RIFCSPLOWO2_12_FULL_60_19]
MLNFTVITLFPPMFASPLGHSILKKAQEKGLIAVRLVDPRDYTTDKHRTVDDAPYGGGQGMVMKPEPLAAAIEDVKSKSASPRVILLSPQGKSFDQAEAQRLSQETELVLVCGRYEGVDERVKAFVDEELSVGDYTLSGGELPAMVVIDAVARLIPGVLGNLDSPKEESFTEGLLEYPQYTRPEEFRGMKVPEVLLSGDHEKVNEWRSAMSLRLTRERRPDLLAKARPPAAEQKATATGRRLYIALLHHPVYDKNGEIVTTAVTNMDIHDIARAGKTYGLRGFYVVTPVKALQRLALKIIAHWEEGYGSRYNETRKEALALARVKDTLDDAIIDVERECGAKPQIVASSARPGGNRASFAHLRKMLREESAPFLLLLGTGWGLTDAVLAQSDYILEPIEGGTAYNHLSVRSAAAIMLDRLLGRD